MEQALAYTAEQLITEFEQYKIPILTASEALQTCFNNQECATSDLLKVIAFDPILCLYVQRFAGEKHATRQVDINGVEHALSILGVAGVQSLIEKTNEIGVDDHLELKQVLAESLLASQIARELAKTKSGYTNDIQAAALFARATDWLLYWMHPKRSWQLRRMRNRKPFTEQSTCEVLFGFASAALQQKICESFHLPHLSQRVAQFSLVNVTRPMLRAIQLYRANDLRLEEHSRELRFQLGAPEMTPIIANRLAQVVCSPWLRNSWQRWVDIAAIHCHQKNSVIEQLVVQCCRQIDQAGVTFTKFLAGSALVNEVGAAPYQEFLVAKNTRPSIATKSSVQPSTASTEGKPRNKVADRIAPYTTNQSMQVKLLCRKLVAGAAAFSSAKEALAETMQEIITVTPIERLSFVAINQSRTKGKSLLTVAKQPSNFSIVVDFEQSKVFKKFLQQQAFLRFDKLKHQAYWAQLPAAILEQSQLDSFMVNSLYYRGQVRALMYADMYQSQRQLPPALISDFKKLCTALSERLRVG